MYIFLLVNHHSSMMESVNKSLSLVEFSEYLRNKGSFGASGVKCHVYVSRHDWPKEAKREGERLSR